MTRSQFFTILIAFAIIFVFLKIYQHNLIIKFNYEKQWLINKKNELKNKKSELLVKLFYLNNQERVCAIAQQDLNMKPLQLSQIIVQNIHNSFYDFDSDINVTKDKDIDLDDKKRL